MKHSLESKAKMAAASRRYHEAASPEAVARRTARAVATKIEKYGTGRAGVAPSNPYSRTKSGRREDLGIYVRSAWEANVARYLNRLIEQGAIRSWEYEAQTFRFEGVTRAPYTYTPDFRVTDAAGRIVFWEVKGWMDSASRSRLKRMQEHFPEIEIRLIGLKEYREISLNAGDIPEWELEKKR